MASSISSRPVRSTRLPAGSRGSDRATHPGPRSSSNEIVAHAVQVHHRGLRSQLLWIAALLEKIGTRTPADEDSWQAVRVAFGDLRQELMSGLMRERYVIFPRIDAASDATLRQSPDLHAAVRAVEKSHARSLQRLWKLVDRVTRAAAGADDAEGVVALVAELDALRDDYYQHLYEMECLLFPRIAPRPAPPPSVAAPAGAKTARSVLQRTTWHG